MQRNKPEIDIIEKVLDACYRNNPDSLFIQGLMHQYEERGSLSKKQLEGAYQKALKVADMPPSWLATLQATINKMHTRFKSPVVSAKPEPVQDAQTGTDIQAILAKFPGHKRVLFFQAKYNNREPLTPAETAELQKFKKLLLK